MYLFDPITCQKTKTDYRTLSGITGHSENDLMKMKSIKRKIHRVKCYLLNDDTPYSELIGYMSKEVVEDEIWANIEDSTWQISNYGRGRYMTSKGWKFAIPQLLRKRLVYQIRGNEGRVTHGVAQLVAKYFMDEAPRDGLRLLHKDDNRWNCRAENLEWVSKSYIGKRYGGLSNSIPVIKIDTETGEELDHYDSMAEAGRENFTCKENIRAALDNPVKTAAGFRWIRANKKG